MRISSEPKLSIGARHDGGDPTRVHTILEDNCTNLRSSKLGIGLEGVLLDGARTKVSHKQAAPLRTTPGVAWCEILPNSVQMPLPFSTSATRSRPRVTLWPCATGLRRKTHVIFVLVPYTLARHIRRIVTAIHHGTSSDAHPRSDNRHSNNSCRF